MKVIELSPRAVDAHFTLMTEPVKHGLTFRPLAECFEPSESATAQHILFKDYATEVPGCTKIFFYLVMEMVYGSADVKDENGNLGFNLRFVPKKGEKTEEN